VLEHGTDAVARSVKRARNTPARTGVAERGPRVHPALGGGTP